MIENLIVFLLVVVVVLLVYVIVKLHQVPAALNLVKTGATTIVSDIEAVIAKHKGA